MSGKKNKARRKQERLRHKRSPQGNSSARGPGDDEVCPLYRNPPGGELYQSWFDCVSVKHAARWAEAVMTAPAAAGEPGVQEWTSRMPYFASVYGRMVPAEAAGRLDQHIDAGYLPVQWHEDSPVSMVSLADMAATLPFGSGESADEVRAGIHQFHAMGFLMLADDGTVIPIVPSRKDLVDEDEVYDPARYQLARTPKPVTQTQIIKRSGSVLGEPRGHPVSGLDWTREEFLALPWVADYMPEDPAADPRDQVCERYGEKIPADLAVLDIAADQTAFIAVANAGRSYVEPHHLHALAGVSGTRQALHRLHDEGLVVALSNGVVVAPGLILERADGS